MEQVTLHNGVEMPILGLGCLSVEDPAVCEQSVVGRPVCWLSFDRYCCCLS